jgi:hypothetical protein
VDALLLAGNAYFQRELDIDKVDKCYIKIFELFPAYDLAFSNYKIILASIKEAEIKKRGYLKIISYRPYDFESNCELGSIYGKVYNNLDSAIFYLAVKMPTAIWELHMGLKGNRKKRFNILKRQLN